jgi:hypothetical protein
MRKRQVLRRRSMGMAKGNCGAQVSRNTSRHDGRYPDR